jgi:small conductance mechanosensitive channel
MENFYSEFLDPKYLALLLQYAPKILLALFALLLGLWFVKRITSAASVGLRKSGIEPDLHPFLVSMINILFKVLLVLGVANIVGIQTTSLVAVLASAAFAVGLALQGTLSNFASGVMILIFKPYRVGDLVEMQGVAGRVEEIQIFNTLIKTPLTKIIIVPNSNAINGIISNLTINNVVKTDIQIPIRYGEDFEEIYNCLTPILKNSKWVLKDYPPEIRIERFNEATYTVAVRASVFANDLELALEELREKIYTNLSQSGIKIGSKRGNIASEV